MYHNFVVDDTTGEDIDEKAKDELAKAIANVMKQKEVKPLEKLSLKTPRPEWDLMIHKLPSGLVLTVAEDDEETKPF